jgi:hypothetical protein
VCNVCYFTNSDKSFASFFFFFPFMFEQAWAEVVAVMYGCRREEFPMSREGEGEGGAPHDSICTKKVSGTAGS